MLCAPWCRAAERGPAVARPACRGSAPAGSRAMVGVDSSTSCSILEQWGGENLELFHPTERGEGKNIGRAPGRGRRKDFSLVFVPRRRQWKDFTLAVFPNVDSGGHFSRDWLRSWNSGEVQILNCSRPGDAGEGKILGRAPGWRRGEGKTLVGLPERCEGRSPRARPSGQPVGIGEPVGARHRSGPRGRSTKSRVGEGGAMA